MNQHLTDDELIDQMYGLVDRRSHLESCEECTRRLSESQERRASLVSAEELPNDFLAAQRRTIYARLGEIPGKQLRWVPALAAACLFAIGVFIFRPAEIPHLDASDAQLFSDVYSMEQLTEPRAAVPIHALFEDNQ